MGSQFATPTSSEIFLPALAAVLLGIVIVFISRYTLARLPGITVPDAVATGGLFGAVSGSTLAAVLPQLDAAKIPYEAWTAALYPFMDIPALVTAIVVASLYISKRTGTSTEKLEIWPIIKESLQSSAVTALLLGVALGILTKPEPVYESFFNPLFRGFLSVLMIIMGMEAAQRMNELRKVAQWFAIYAFIAPIVHGFLAFGLGLVIHKITGFSIGGAVVLAVIAASSSDISGPPDPASRYSLGESLGLHRCLHGHRHSSGDRHLHPSLHRACGGAPRSIKS